MFLTLLAIATILGSVALAAIFSVVYTSEVASISLDSFGGDEEMKPMQDKPEVTALLKRNYNLIKNGANAFLLREYYYMGVFVVGFAALLVVVLGTGHNWASGIFSALSFVAGSLTSILSGYIGMSIAVFANARTTVSCVDSIGSGFNTAFKAGSVMGFALVASSILVLFGIVLLFHLYYKDAFTNKESDFDTRMMFEAIAGYGLGGSSIAMFGRVGGGIYTKAADVGADLAGKVEAGWEEDDPRNPAVIADNVGDNVGDIAGMGADLFGSLAEASCAAMVIASQSEVLRQEWAYMAFPMLLMSAGIVVCFLTTFLATHINPVRDMQSVEPVLMAQLVVSTILMTPAAWVVCAIFLPSEFAVPGKEGIKNWHVFICVASGLWSGLAIGKLTEYYTSNAYQPVKDVALSCAQGGAAPNIIYGLALGYKSCVFPVMLLALNIFISYYLAHMFGVAVSALGVLSTLAIGLTIDAYGPITDNAGGIAEMSGFPEYVRERTDKLDAAGNTTAAIGKGFAISSAAMVSLALFGAFVDTVGLTSVDLLQPLQFAGLLVGAMIPYWFSAMTMKSVGMAANAMVEEVRRQVKALKGNTDDSKNGGDDDWRVFGNELSEARRNVQVWQNKVKQMESKKSDEQKENPCDTKAEQYSKCIQIATDASLQEMIAPGCLVIFTPIIVGFFFGVEALAGLLAGSLVSSVQMAISASNSGGAWDNAKKYISGQNLHVPVNGVEKRIIKKTKIYHDVHNASVIGDTVGDPLKDTSGPALNIVMKLMAIISLVFGPSFPSIKQGGLIAQFLEAA
mmetsp:Transcript_25935/g.62469  ORF Transcript_25935/g.62469 Transcript_25935/m.62469 type:complete len:796 (-) Transcript_25935:291-2678(-)